VVNSAIRQLHSEPAEGYLICELRADKALFTTHDGLSLGNKQLVMSFTNKPSVTLTLDEVVELVDQLSPADKLKVAKRLRTKERDEAVKDLIKIFSKVKMSEKEVTALVEDVRTERYASQQAHHAGR
jgi:hypothetical protein